MVKVQGAVISERGITFAIVIVKPHILEFTKDREEAAQSFSRLFSKMPVILMAQDARGEPKYWGRKDIVDFLLKTGIDRIQWKEYTFQD